MPSPSHILLDTAGPLLWLLVGLPLALIALCTVVVVEAILLRVLNWDVSFGRCLLHSLLANAASSLIGCALTLALQRAISFQTVVQFLAIFFVAFALSVLVEGLVLMGLKPAQRRSAWRNAIILNLVSYVILFGITLIGVNL